MVGAIISGDSMRHIFRTLAVSGLLLTTALSNAAFAADPEPMDKRVERLEKELRAVQRKVFPGGAPVQPDITTPEVATVAPSTSTPVMDLMTRVTSLESQIATLTGQLEQNNFKLRQLEEKVNHLVAEATPPAVDAAAAAAVGLASSPSTAAPATAKPTPAKPASPAPRPEVAAASTARKAAVAAIERPETGNPAADAYSYGYRLWEAKFYPEAQVQLKTAVEKHGDSSFGSRSQNLLGRAYLDDGKPALASVAFYENYQKRPNGDRAAQSLAYLGEALIQLRKPADACKVYDELQKSYGSSLAADLRAMMEKGRARAKCGA